MKRGDLLRYEVDGSLWIVEWANERYVKLVGVANTLLIEYSDLVVISANR